MNVFNTSLGLPRWRSAGDARDGGSIPGSGRSPGVGNGNPLQYSCLEDSMDRGTWRSIQFMNRKESDTTEATKQALDHTLGLLHGDRRWLGSIWLVVVKASLLGGDRSQMRKWLSRSSGPAGPPASLPLDMASSPHHLCFESIIPRITSSNGSHYAEGQMQAPGNLQRTWPWSPLLPHLLPPLPLLTLVQGLCPSFSSFDVVMFIPSQGLCLPCCLFPQSSHNWLPLIV